MKKNKKILFGILIGLSFLLLLMVKNANAGCEFTNSPQCTQPVPCNQIMDPIQCNNAQPCCEWKEEEAPTPPPPKQPSEVYFVCKPSIFLWETIVCWINYFITLNYRIPLFLFAMIGIILAMLFLAIGWLIVPTLANFFINLSLNNTFYDAFAGQVGVVRDFALSLLTIFILLIGLGTILRLAEYEAKKTLVSLIVAALLVYFSLPICKEIIKIGNEFTLKITDAFFPQSPVGEFWGLQGKNYLDVGNVYQALWNALLNHIAENVFKILVIDGDLVAFFTNKESANYPGIYGPILLLIGLISLSYWIFAFIIIYVGIVLLAFGIVFFIRLVYLACLIVVAPIAFLTAGIRTKEIRHMFPGFLNFDGWLEQFLEWTFIGVVIMIWLGVGILIMQNIKIAPSTSSAPSSTLFSQGPSQINFRVLGDKIDPADPPDRLDPNTLRDQEAKFALEALKGFIPVFALAVAIHIGVTTSRGMMKSFAEGAIKVGHAISTAILTAGAAAVGAAAGAASAAGGGMAGLKAGATTGAKEFFKTGARTFFKEAELGKAVPRPIAAVGEEVVAPWARRVGIFGREAAAEEKAKERKKIEDYVDNIWKTKGAEGVEELARSTKERPEVRDVAIEKLKKERKLRDEVIDNPEFQAFLATPQGSKHAKDVLKLRVDLAPQFINPKTNRPFSPEDIIKEMTPADVIKIRPKALLVPEVVSAMEPRQIGAIIRKGSIQQKESLKESYAEIIRRETNLILDTSTPKNLERDILRNRMVIQNTINRLRRSPDLSDQNRAEILKEIGNAIYQRKL
jgi:hypothetical protein